MKLATRNNGNLDGELLVVSRDLSRAVSAAEIVPSLRLAVERWESFEPQLRERASALESGSVDSFAFDAAAAMAPLPRSFQWLDASTYRIHGERIVKAFGVPSAYLHAGHPVMYQGCSDRFYGAQEDYPLPAELDIDLEAEIAVITDHIPMASTPEQVHDSILLVMLADDVSLRALIQEMSLGFGMIRSKPSTAFSPVAVTLDELGPAWKNGVLHGTMHAYINGRLIGSPNAREMEYNFHQLIAHAASTRELTPGTILGSGTVANVEESAGVTCLAEQRAKEKLTTGEPITPFLKFGDTVRIEMLDDSGNNIFGTIQHKFVKLSPKEL